MGPTESAPYTHRTGNSMMAPIVSPKQLKQSGFSALWSVSLPDSITPIPRSHHFSVHVRERESVIIGYGKQQEQAFNDLWVLDLFSNKWSQLHPQPQVTPRFGSTAALVGTTIVVFGGQIGTKFVGDLHFINPTTNEVMFPSASEGPCGRIGHAMGCYGTQICIWGGYNGTYLKDLWVLDLPTNTWKEITCDEAPRADVGFAMHGSTMYVMCASKSDMIIRYNFETEIVDSVLPTGNPPPFGLTGPLVCAVDRYLFLLGGNFESKQYTMLRAYDVVKNWWFVFYIRADSNTTTIEDGAIDNNGIFLVPRTNNGSIAYRERTREVVVFLGVPYLTTVPLSIMHIGEALATLHHQNDMYDALHCAISD